MTTVLDYMYQLPKSQKAIMLALHELFIDYPKVTSKIRYRIPFYYQKSWICYMNPLKNQGVELVFVRANELSNEQGLLDSKGRKQVAGIEITDLKDIELEGLREVFNEALILDEMVPYASKRKSK